MHHSYDSIFKQKIGLILTSPFKMKLALVFLLVASAFNMSKLKKVTLFCQAVDLSILRSSFLSSTKMPRVLLNWLALGLLPRSTKLD